MFFNNDKKFKNNVSVAYQYLGPRGRILSTWKKNPVGKEDHTIYCNGCVFDKYDNEIWYGDIDLTEKDIKLKELAKAIGTIYVTPEQPWRFKGFKATRKTHHKDKIIKFKG